MGPIKVMKFNPVYDSVISADTKGIIEYWNPATLQFPEDEYVLYLVSYFSSASVSLDNRIIKIPYLAYTQICQTTCILQILSSLITCILQFEN
jgi:hypothetical protein